jgi:hypothetical protein
MYEFTLYNFNAEGIIEPHSWEFTPVDREPGFDITKADKARATGSLGNTVFSIKEVWQITIGAGTLRFDDHRINFVRLITSKKIVWKRQLGNRTIETEFELETDRRVMLEYLQDRRSLKRKTFTLVEKEANYYDSFEEFYERYMRLINDNALW